MAVEQPADSGTPTQHWGAAVIVLLNQLDLTEWEENNINDQAL